MADFWAGFGQGFSRQAGKSWERAASKRDRREELEALQEYQEKLADKKEEKERLRASEKLAYGMELMRRKPYAKGLLPEGETIRGELEEVSFKDPSPLFGQKGLRREITQKTPEAALRELSLEQKTAIAKQIEIEKGVYENMLEQHKDAVGKIAAAFHLQKDEDKETSAAELRRLRKRYEGDPTALEKLDLAITAEKQAALGDLGKIFKTELIKQDLKKTEEDKDFEEQNSVYLELLVKRDGGPNKKHPAEARAFFNLGDKGFRMLQTQVDSSEGLRGIMAMAEDQGIEVPAGIENNFPLLEKWADENIRKLQPQSEWQKKLTFIGDYRKKADEAKKLLDEAVALKGEDDVVMEQEALNNAIGGMRFATAAAFTKGWEMDVDEDGKVFARKIDADGNDAGANYKIGYHGDVAGNVRAYAKIKEGLSDPDYAKAQDASSKDIARFVGLAQAGQTPSGLVADPPPVGTSQPSEELAKIAKKEEMEKIQALLEKMKLRTITPDEKVWLERVLPDIPPLPR